MSAYWLYILITARFFGAIYICPIFGSTFVPNTVKILLSLTFASIAFPIFINDFHSNNVLLNIILLVKEVAIGAVLGYIFGFPMWLIENIGNFIDLQRGEQFGAVVNQLTHDPSSSISKLIFQGFVAYFVTIGGLTFFIKTILLSFTLLKPMELTMHIPATAVIIDIFCKYFYWMIILSLPAIVAMYLLELTLGIFSSFIPQLNVTVLSMPIKSLLALLILSLYLEQLYHFVITRFIDANLLRFF